MAFILDASVAISWSFRDEHNSYAHRVLRLLAQDSAIVPPLWSLEVANALIVAERRKRFTAADVSHIRDDLVDLPIEVADISMDQTLHTVLDLARSQGLSTYDAAYLYLAMREGLPLATQDEALRLAAANQGVRLVE